jgi:hypothetical protein
MDFARVLDLVTTHLSSHGFSWAVAGGAAMQAYGLARATQDLDFVTESAAADELVSRLEAAGYETLYRSEGFSNHVHADPSLGRVDFIYLEPGTAELLFAAARPVPWGGLRVLVPSPLHMIAMKVHAMKNDPSRSLREMADVQHLLLLEGVDRATARRYFEDAGLAERFNEIARFL